MKSELSLVALASLSCLAVACGDDTSASGGAPAGSGCEPAVGCPEVVSDCIAFADQAGADVFSLRISQLTVQAPAALTDTTVKNLLSKGVTLDDGASCQSADGNAFFNGDGTFNWILNFDLATGTLRTGGAELQTDPTKPYCFLSGDIAGFDVSPLEAPISLEGDTFTIDEVRNVAVPIFTDPTDQSKVIILPLNAVRIFDTTFSADHNCIGTFNPDLDPNNLCLPDAQTPTFLDAGNLEGYVTLEDADAVLVPELGNASLCTLIAGAEFTDQATKKCLRDGSDVITFQGDWCAGTAEGDPGSAATGTCADAVQLRATFSASGATLSDSCN
jgi:hypothetical protein